MYFYILERLMGPKNTLDKNKLSIVTFNYDRSFEEFLFSSMMNSFRLSVEEASELSTRVVPVVHVHGNLGDLYWQNQDGRPYEPHVSPESIRIAAQGIRIIHETGEHNNELQKAKNMLADAKRIIFLGFGYNSVNTHRLGFTHQGAYTGAVMGSGYGLTNREKVFVQKHILKGANLGEPSWDSVGYLRETGMLY